MTWCCTEDRWTCPTCQATWVRSDTQTHDDWITRLRAAQTAHGRRCGTNTRRAAA